MIGRAPGLGSGIPAEARTGLQRLQVEDTQRLLRYAECLAFYNGQHYRAQRRGRTNLVINYARAIVDKGVSFLLGRGIGMAVEPSAWWRPSAQARALLPHAREAQIAREDQAAYGATLELPPERAGAVAAGEQAAAGEAYLYQIYDANDLEAVDLACALNAAVLGDGVYKVYWDAGQQRVRVMNVDPSTCFLRWQSDDCTELQCVDCGYTLDADAARDRYGVSIPTGGPLAARVPVLESWTDTAYRLEVAGQEVQVGPNPYGVIPFVHVPNLPEPNQAWGRSDLVDVIPLNRELNERISDQADIIRYHADPPVVFTGVESHDSLTVGPGTVWDLPQDADVKLLEWQGQPIAVQEHIESVRRALYETAETPRTAFGDSGRLLSGVALETELRPLVQRTQRKRITWTVALRRRARLIFRVAEAAGVLPPGTAEALRVRIIWPSMMPSDDRAEVANNVALVAAGLRSRRTAMDLLGTESPEVELARVVEDLQTAGPVQTVSSMQGG
jgi:hypothetical protein